VKLGEEKWAVVDRYDAAKCTKIVPRGWSIARIAEWKADMLVVGDFECEVRVKLVGLVSEDQQEALFLVVHKLVPDSDDVIQCVVNILESSMADFENVARAIEEGPIVPDSREDM